MKNGARPAGAGAASSAAEFQAQNGRRFTSTFQDPTRCLMIEVDYLSSLFIFFFLSLSNERE
jgi:hypothetical protein